ncbi:MAG: hypothetical protein N4A49_04510 [Marinifilaceae bacterium]|jgi:hypothetical protein|nr:hypothetical protein [Marinifilaceae bacterium]
MSSNKCGKHTYSGINRTKMDGIIYALEKNGAKVTGSNPWKVNTNNHGIKLKGVWERADSTLTITIEDKDFYVPCHKIWHKLNEMLSHMATVSDSVIEQEIMKSEKLTVV